MAEVRFEGVAKRFKSVTALDSVDLVVPDRSFTCLVGPSGSGKSTLLNLTAGFDEPTAGSVLIDGRDVSADPPGARDIAMVFQNYALYPHMTVFDNIAFGLRMQRMPNADIRTRVEEAGALLQLTGLFERKPRQLSGGQRQRVAVARAITRHPKVFLLDEPLSNLDAQLRFETRAELKLLFERIGGTVIYVTHDQTEAMTLGDQVVVLDGGRLQQIGPPLDVYRRPANSFVARFIGSPAMNLLPTTVRDGTLTAAGLALSIDDRADLQGRDIVLGFRPEAVELGRPGTLAASGDVAVIERLGAQDILYFQVAGDARVMAARPTDAGAVEPGSVSWTVPAAQLHFFDAEGGQRLHIRVRDAPRAA